MEGFIFYTSFLEAIKELPNDSQLRLYQAITNFALNQIEPDNLQSFEKAVFAVIKPQLIANRQRYENGCKGGRPKKKTNDKLKENQSLNKQKTDGYENKKPVVINSENLNINKKRNINKNININNKKENNIKEKSLAVVKPTAHTEQGEVFEYFSNLYKQETNIDYLGKGIDYINLAKLIKKYGKALVIQKINWLLVGCKKSVFWFSKDINDFNVSTLFTQWDRILPKLTEEQKREQEKKKKEEADRLRVKAELAKQGIVFDDEGGMNNVRLQ